MLQETTSQPGSSRRSCRGRSLASSGRSRRRWSWARTSRLSDQTPCGGPSANRRATEVGASTGLHPSGRLTANLYSRWSQRFAGFDRRSAPAFGGVNFVADTRASNAGAGVLVRGILGEEEERVELAVGDDADAHLAPEAALVGVRFPDGLEPVTARVLDDPVDRQLAIRAGVALGIPVDARAVIVEAFGGQGQLAGGDAGRPECGLRHDRHEDPVLLLARVDLPRRGDSRRDAVLGGFEWSGGRSGLRGGCAATTTTRARAGRLMKTP